MLKYSFKFLILILVLCIFSISAQQIHFRYLTIDNGLSQNAVLTIIQDSHGYMWFGTKDGLNRYDGYNFKIFQNDPADTTTISSNFITTAFEDHSGKIWIGTLNGNLNIFNEASGTFKRVNELVNRSQITTITEDSSGSIWIGTGQNGIFRIIHNADYNYFSFDHYQALDHPGSLASNMISSVFVDWNGTLWVGNSEGLNKFNKENSSFTFYKIITKNPAAQSFPADNAVSAISQLNAGRLILGTPSGIAEFTISNAAYNFYPHHFDVHRFGWGRITNIEIDHSGMLWLATPGGLMLFNPKTKSYRYFNNDPVDPGTISYNSVSSIRCDKSGIIWIGTPGAGINIYDPKANRFALLQRKSNTPSRVIGFSVSSICEDNNGDVWVGSDVVYRWKRSTDELISYETSSDRPDDFGNTRAWSIVKGNDGVLWFASTQGLFSYDVKKEKARQYSYIPGSKNGLPQKSVYGVFVDDRGSIWAVTENYFCRLADPGKGIFINYRYNMMAMNNAVLRPVIYQDKSGVFWIGSDLGLISFDEANGKFKKYVSNPADSTSLNNNYIKSICPDPGNPERYLWIGTSGGGLNKFDKVSEKFSSYTKKDGLPNNVIYGILSDSKGRLWMSTNHGLSVFNPAANKFRNFDVLDGLQSNEFNTGAFYKSASGEMFFGGISGLNYFYPQDIKDNNFIPGVVITSCEVLNESGAEGDQSEFINSPEGLRTITLTFEKNNIRFEFAALDYSAPEKNKYKYILENFNDNWIIAGNKHSASFTNLPPGHYVFRVKGSNNDGLWNEKGASLNLIILPPWWRTWWAYVLYGLVFFSGLYFLRRYELNRLQLKNQLKLEKIETDSLRHLDQLKSRFFANISHEFRTPLTLILGQVESVLSSDINTKSKSKLHIANRNARRLLTLINQLLDISKIEAGSMPLKAEQHNIVSFLKSLFYSFESLADTKQITLKFESDLVNIPVVFEPDKMEKVFYNLFSNAFKFTPPGGTITVEAQISGASAVIIIRDTGTGIPSDRINKIFDRFYQLDNSSTREHEGSGIGLALTKELIELHKGKIEVKSKIDEGSEFIITLPLGNLNTPRLAPEVVAHNDVFHDISTDSDIESKVEISSDKNAMKVGEGEIILIVEDNFDVRNYLREQLELEYTVIDARNGEAGIAKARGIVPDLIITDIMMPKMDGYRFSTEIRKDERTSHIPVIMLTAKAGLDDKIEGLETGIDAYLTKPFSTRELKVRVRNLIQQRKELRKRFSSATVIKPSDVSAVSADQAFLKRTISIIEKHYDDIQFGVELLASETGMSLSQLNRKLKALIDQPAGQLIRSLRLQRAADLLKKNSGTVAEICYQVGFNDQSYFSRAFKKQFGCSPSDYKKLA